ncbi:YdcF family protein [Geothrix sp. PMB-07]|uniref:YdcF family protein n=1 Tax=Geothrix sp. PMB-07 TaxID=3068640 RepID=UPI0027404C50|nr:YdcF family protein [Geothrix sp. PMB-07]WLT32539.1 YdcF family protein [Geothrix sp. PMB-07]
MPEPCATATLAHATRLWEYLASGRQRQVCEAIVVCCSYDLRVADHACALFHQGLAPRIVFTGKTGTWTRHLWSRPESHIFRDHALAQGIPPEAILVEDRATNFGENLRFTRALLPNLQSATFVTKPNSMLRVALSLPIQWQEITACVDAPEIRFPEETSNVVGILGLIEEMVGDVQRIQAYPALGFQAPHALPEAVLESWQALVEAGFTGHLMSKPA